MGERERAHLARGRERGRAGRRRSAHRARRELHGRDRRHRVQHGLRLGQDLHERLPHRHPGRQGASCRPRTSERSRTSWRAGPRPRPRAARVRRHLDPQWSQNYFDELQLRPDGKKPAFHPAHVPRTRWCSWSASTTGGCATPSMRATPPSAAGSTRRPRASRSGRIPTCSTGRAVEPAGRGRRKAQAAAAGAAQQAAFVDPPGPSSDPQHLLRVLFGVFLLCRARAGSRAPMFELRRHAEPDRADPGHVDRAQPAHGHRGAGRVARTAHVHQGVGWWWRATVGVAAVLRFARQALGVLESVRRVLQQALRGLLERGLRHADGRAVPGAGGAGRGPGRDRQVDRVRRREGLRRLHRALRGLPAEGGAGALRALHADLAVHRRVHRPVPAPQGGALDQRGSRGDRRGRRGRVHPPARQGHLRGQRPGTTSR